MFEMFLRALGRGTQFCGNFLGGDIYSRTLTHMSGFRPGRDFFHEGRQKGPIPRETNFAEG